MNKDCLVSNKDLKEGSSVTAYWPYGKKKYWQGVIVPAPPPKNQRKKRKIGSSVDTTTTLKLGE